MTTGVLMADIIKTGFITLITSKTCSCLGKKDYADILKCSGLSICGCDMVQILLPICKGVKDFCDSVGKICGGIENGFDKVTNGIKKVGDAITFWD